MRTEATPYLKNLSDCIIQVMNERGWSARMTADFCGISGYELSFILRGAKDDIRLSTLAKISQGLDIPVEVLLTRRVRPEIDSEIAAICAEIVKATGKIRKVVKE